MVVTVRDQPVRASLRSSSTVAMRLSSWRVNVGWGFYMVERLVLLGGGVGKWRAYFRDDEL